MPDVPRVTLQLTLDNVRSAATKLRHQADNNTATIGMTDDAVTLTGKQMKEALRLQNQITTQAMEDLARVETALGPLLNR